MKKFFTLITAVLFAGGMMAADLLNIDFTKGQGAWTINDVNKDTLGYVWKQDAQYGMKATAYVNKAAHATESWLISPAMDMTNVADAKLLFSQALNKGDVSSVSVKAKAGDGDWTVLTVAPKPAGNNWNFVDSEAELKDFAGKANVQIAFVYTSTATSAATWEIKTVVVNDGVVTPGTIADVVFTSTEFNGQGTSGTGGQVTATKDGVTFTCDKAFGDQYGVRCYKGSVVTITSTTEQIGKIVFDFATVSGKTYNGGGMASEIVVNAKTWSLTMADQARMNKISIFFGEFEKPQETDPTPTVTPELPEGVLNCAGVKTLAATASDPTAENKTVEVADVKVRGYVISVYAAKNGTQSAWIADDKSAKAGEVQGYNLKISEEVAKGDYVHMEGKLAKFFKAADNIILEVVNGTMAKVAADGTVTPVDPTPVQLDTITVAKALEIGRALDSAAVTPNQYVIKGYVSNIETPYNPSFKNETFWMTDEKGSRAASNEAGAFEVYRGKPDTEKEIGLDAYVFVTAKIQKFKGTTIETSGNVTVQVVEQGVEEVIDTITVAQALAIGKELTESNKEKSYPSEKRYAIKGYVSSIVERYSSYGNETFWITDTKGSRTNDKEVAFEVFRGKPNTGAEVGLDAYVLIVCKIKNYQGTIENDGTNVPVEVLEQGELKIDTITVAQAIEKTQALAAGAVSEEFYAVKAYIAGVQTAYSAEFGNISLFLSDDPTATQSDFSCYRAKIDAADVEKAVHGAYVIVTGHLDNNSHGLQMASGASIEFAEAPKVQRVTVAQALAIGNALAAGAKTAERYEVVGYVASILEEYEEGVQSFIMTEDATATTGSFYIGNAYIAAPGAAAHDYVGVVGFIENDGQYIQIYNGQATINPAGEGIELINVATPKAQKVLMDGVIYIVRDGKIFNLQGAQVR
jgi:hypothetical protein